MNLVNSYKRARLHAGATLADVGDRSGIQIPNLSAIENGKRIPRADTLDRVLSAVGKKFIAVTNTRASAAEIAEEIETELARGRTGDLFRYVAQLSDNLVAAATPEDFYALVLEPAPTTGRQDWDAAIAGLVEFRANQRGWPPPSWTDATKLSVTVMPVDIPWLEAPESFASLREFESSSKEFESRGVFVAISDLGSV